MYDDILLPVAPNSEATRAIPHAVMLADRYDATVHVLAAVDTLEKQIDDPEAGTLAERVEDAAHDRVREIGADFESRGVDVRTHVEHDVPHAAIRETADDVEADLVIVPTHSRQGLERFLLGSVTERVIRQSPVPVLAVPMEEPPESPGST